MSTVPPWELQPALTQERLVTLARLVAETRNKVFAEADREAGDTNWGLACRAHERLGHALVRAAADGSYPWLTVNREGLYLMPIIDGVPIRPYRGAPEKPGSRHLDALRFEASRTQPKQTAFSFMEALDQDGPWFWLMAMETDASGQVARVTFLQANDAGQTRNAWPCPLDVPATAEPEVAERKRRAPPRAPGRARAPRPAQAPADLAFAPLLSVAVGGAPVGHPAAFPNLSPPQTPPFNDEAGPALHAS